MQFEKIFEPGRIKGLETKNRLVMPPITTNFATDNGGVSDQMIAYYAERAKGGVGTIIVENACVDYPAAKNTVLQSRIDDDKFVAGFKELSEAIQIHGARAVLQIQHSGRETTWKITEGSQPVAPSPVPCGFLKVQPRELTILEIQTIVEMFANAADRAKQAGFDGVEIHGAHGYLIAQFMDAYTNRRVDAYGGTFEKRMRFPLEVARAVRERVGEEYPIFFRYCADEFVDGARKIDESIRIAQFMEQEAGIDVLDVSVGTYESRWAITPPMAFAQACMTHLHAAIKQKVNIPVIAVGKIRTPEVAEQVLREGKADFVAIGRTLIADPYWPKKVREGRSAEIRRCISDLEECLGHHVFKGLHMRCTVNPDVGRELSFAKLEPARIAKRVMVVGGGPGGMEAARVATLRGHQVTLYEKQNELGGLLKVAAVPPYKDENIWLRDYLTGQITALNIPVRLGTEITIDLIRRENPDVVVLATGGRWVLPDIPGMDQNTVTTSEQLLLGEVPIPDQVIVARGASGGCEVAEFLLEMGKEVTIVEKREELGFDLELMTRELLVRRLAQDIPESMAPLFKRPTMPNRAKPTVLLRSVIDSINADGAVVLNSKMEKRQVQGKLIVFTMARETDGGLLRDVQAIVPEAYAIGDCVKSGKIADAMYQGSYVARQI
jgi:2,4-dienoyl-CoA reductase-like NADH-dependent reductase (Old Yellow Enzyme family)/thioredoxin reductase